MYLALEDELEGEGALAGEVGVALRVVHAGLQHPRLVEDSEARRFIVQTSDEVISAVRPELHLWVDTQMQHELERRRKAVMRTKTELQAQISPNNFILFFIFIYLFIWGGVTCKPNLLVTQQAEDAVVQLHVSAVALVHLSQYSHEFCSSLRGV